MAEPLHLLLQWVEVYWLSQGHAGGVPCGAVQGRAGLGVSFLCFLLEHQINKIQRHLFYSIETLFETF